MIVTKNSDDTPHEELKIRRIELPRDSLDISPIICSANLSGVSQRPRIITFRTVPTAGTPFCRQRWLASAIADAVIIPWQEYTHRRRRHVRPLIQTLLHRLPQSVHIPDLCDLAPLSQYKQGQKENDKRSRYWRRDSSLALRTPSSATRMMAGIHGHKLDMDSTWTGELIQLLQLQRETWNFP